MPLTKKVILQWKLSPSLKMNKKKHLLFNLHGRYISYIRMSIPMADAFEVEQNIKLQTDIINGHI